MVRRRSRASYRSWWYGKRAFLIALPSHHWPSYAMSSLDKRSTMNHRTFEPLLRTGALGKFCSYRTPLSITESHQIDNQSTGLSSQMWKCHPRATRPFRPVAICLILFPRQFIFPKNHVHKPHCPGCNSLFIPFRGRGEAVSTTIGIKFNGIQK